MLVPRHAKFILELSVCISQCCNFMVKCGSELLESMILVLISHGRWCLITQSGHTKVDTSLDFVRFLFRDVVVSHVSALNSTSTPGTSTYLESVWGWLRGRELPGSVLGNLSSFSSDILIVSGWFSPAPLVVILRVKWVVCDLWIEYDELELATTGQRVGRPLMYLWTTLTKSAH
jgi:hypothetical protein